MVHKRLKTVCFFLLWILILGSSTSAMAEMPEQQLPNIEKLTEEQQAALAELDRRWKVDTASFMSWIPEMKRWVKKLDELAEQGPLTPDQEGFRKMLKKRLAQVPPLLPDEYTLLCQSEVSVGVDWENGMWEQSHYKNHQRLVVKSKDNDCGSRTKLNDDIDTTETGNIWWYSRNVCLNERRFGDPYYHRLGSHYCEEVYENDDLILNDGAKTPYNTTIRCEEPKMVLKPDGWYHYAHIHNDLADRPTNRDSSKRDYKDSQYVEVGKCSMIMQ